MQDANAWSYIIYPHLVNKTLSKQRKEYRIVNDSFIFTIIQFIEGDYVKRISKEATENISLVRAYYI